MPDPSSSAATGLGLFATLFLVLLVLKLAAVAPVAAWSWWAVTAPLWGPWALVLLVLFLGLLWSGLVVLARGRR